MADDVASYPQIPGRVWWGIRSMFKARPSTRLTEQTLATQLNVQPSAARAYLKQMQMVSLLDENGAATDLAAQWRNDATYAEAIQEILEKAYPKDLVDAFPPGEADVTKVTNWFEYGGLGSGTARNKAATYVLIANGSPSDGDVVAGARATRKAKKTESSGSYTKTTSQPGGTDTATSSGDLANATEMPQLNLNIQIHISADATKDQIETIFRSMHKYLRNDNR